MPSVSINDLKYLFYGGGTDEEYAFLLAAYDAGISAADLLGIVTGGVDVTNLNFERAAAGDDILTSKVTGDAASRFVIDADGRLLFGGGAGAGDTNLYRSAADQLTTDDRLNVGGLIVGSQYVYAYDGNANQVRMGATGSGPGLVFGTDLDTNLYRSAADTLKTDDAFVASSLHMGTRGFRNDGVDSIVTDAGASYSGLRVRSTGSHEVKLTGNSILFGADLDVNLYREALNELKTDDALRVESFITAEDGNTHQVALGQQGPSNEAGIKLGSAGDTVLYRSAANTVRSPDTLIMEAGVETDTGNLISHRGDAAKVSVGDVGGTVAGILLGSNGDVNLYRYGENLLKTDDSLVAALNLFAREGATSQVTIGNKGPSAEAGITFGNSDDTNLYRAGASSLKTDDIFAAAQDVYACDGLATQTGIGRFGPSSEAGIFFGSAADTRLYRSAADVLRTDDEFWMNAEAQFNSGASLFRNNNASAQQTTVGAAGAASALPATPEGFFKVRNAAGATVVIPFYLAS